jgi:hypothetical protein
MAFKQGIGYISPVPQSASPPICLRKTDTAHVDRTNHNGSAPGDKATSDLPDRLIGPPSEGLVVFAAAFFRYGASQPRSRISACGASLSVAEARLRTEPREGPVDSLKGRDVEVPLPPLACRLPLPRSRRYTAWRWVSATFPRSSSRWYHRISRRSPCFPSSFS